MSTTSESRRPLVGVAAIILNPADQLLVGKRKGSHGAGTWQLPGGHLEFRESTAACAERETKEETALDVAAEKFVKMTEDVFESDGKHYITLFMSCRMADPGATPQLLEPNKCEGWHWKSWDELKEMRASVDLFLPLQHLIDTTSGIEQLKY